MTPAEQEHLPLDGRCLACQMLPSWPGWHRHCTADSGRWLLAYGQWKWYRRVKAVGSARAILGGEDAAREDPRGYEEALAETACLTPVDVTHALQWERGVRSYRIQQEPVRCAIMGELRKGPTTIFELTMRVIDETGCSAQAVSMALSRLAKSGRVKRTRSVKRVSTGAQLAVYGVAS